MTEKQAVSSQNQYVHRERFGKVLRVTISRESKLNAMNSVLMQELSDCFREAGRMDEVNAIVLTGTGKAFMAGADIAEYGNLDVAGFKSFQDRGREMYRAIETCPKPVVAAVNGYALGGGFELALACDLILASDKARFGLPEVKLGLVPGGGGTQRIGRILGPYRAKELLMTGRMVTAEEGLSLGFVNRIIAADELASAALAFAEQLAEQAPLAVEALKKLVNEGADASLESAQAYDRAYLSLLFFTADAQEGISAFIEKRPPVFQRK